jgi:hypothetical protein
MLPRKFTSFVCAVSCILYTSITFGQTNSKINYKTYIPDSIQIVNLEQEKLKTKYPKPFKKEWSVGLRIPNRGWSIFFDYAFLSRSEKVKANEKNIIYNATVITLELGEKIDNKELKEGILGSLISPTGLGYVYGKKNTLYNAKLMVSRRTLLSGKVDKGNIGVYWVAGGGFVLGLLKPYYLDVPGWGEVKYSEDTRNAFLGGQASGHRMLAGFGEMEYIPGITIKNGFLFDFAGNLNKRSALEIGASLEYFFSDVELMVNSKPRNIFAGVYLSYQFGKLK